ncbi:opioid growth factor receptor isoform X1 [Neophocaena asiaeorientalis asiaeorientalis]|uniref:Opioid growth factor receptor isoform X1 n=1 Tax=Neophocaena asiaeorientalis asiaeorientalis TaxID=1706337 RepID=A0A341BV32_NEOAA|nr:opioid growth factor receptor isoform X1 [Neophocaena asiaeorientalis asiaeorientalis]
MEDPDCDSTWEEDEEEDGEGPRAGADEDGEAGAPRDVEAEADARPSAFQVTGSRNWRAARDTRRYRHHYPDLVEGDASGDMPNLSFYKNEIRFLPNGCFIEDILQNWKEEYGLLEDNHSYIQWLFPLREPGVNCHAKPLTLQEVEVSSKGQGRGLAGHRGSRAPSGAAGGTGARGAPPPSRVIIFPPKWSSPLPSVLLAGFQRNPTAFKSSTEARKRLVQAYELMLGFFGIQLKDRDTGRVCRAQNYQKRFQNLSWHSHNNLRITRILKSLGELGLEHYQAPLARFFLEETLVRRQLPGVRQSALDYFVFAVRCRHQRRELLYFAWEHFRPRCRFVWGPHDKLQKFRPCSPPCSPQPARPRQANREESPGEPLLEAAAQGQTCGPGRDEEGDPVAKGPQPPGTEPQEAGASEKDQGDEAGDEQGPESPNPKERKKRKLEANLRARSPGEPGPSASEVEKIALNLEGCALSQGSLGAETQEVGSQAPEEAEQPRPQPLEAKVADDVRKRRKTDQGARDGTGVAAGDGTVTLAAAQPPAPSRCPAAEEGENGVKEEADGPAGPEQGAPGSPATAGPEVDERAEPTEAGPSVQPGEP